MIAELGLAKDRTNNVINQLEDHLHPACNSTKKGKPGGCSKHNGLSLTRCSVEENKQNENVGVLGVAVGRSTDIKRKTNEHRGLCSKRHHFI